MFNSYAMRVNLSVAMVAMVNSSGLVSENNSYFPSECPVQLEAPVQRETKEFNGDRYNWDSETQGWVMSSFFVGYFISNFLGGYVAEKLGSIRVFGGGVFINAVLTLLTPLVVRWGVVPLMVIRSLEGLGQGVTFPAMTVIISHWAPKLERSRISSIIFSGATLGNVITSWMSGWLCSTSFLGGWPSVFYVSGFLACMWFFFWCILVYETPHAHPYITRYEISHFHEIGFPKEQSFKVPWRKIATSLPFWAVLIANFGCLFGLFLLMTELPTYLNTSLHFNVNTTGMLSALPYGTHCMGIWIASYFADKLRTSGKLRITTIRKVFQSIAGYGAGVCLLAITFSQCRPFLIVALFSISMAVKGSMYSGFNIIHVDMSPELAGILYGLTNGLASLSGVIGPAMVGFLTASGYTVANWNKVFYITATVYFASTTFFNLFASAEPQPWGKTVYREDKGNSKNDIPILETKSCDSRESCG